MLIIDFGWELIFFLDRYIFQRTKMLHSWWKILSYKTSSTMKCIMLIILIIMAEHGFGQSDKKLSQETNFYSNHFIRNKTYNKKIRLAKSRTLYYASKIMILRLILSVDIPSNKQAKVWNWSRTQNHLAP